MNKQELIEKIEKLPFVLLSERYISQNYVLELLEQLDEPQKVVVPQFVAEYIEQKKDDDYHLLGAMIEIRSYKNKEIDEWFEFEEDDNMETFARAWLDGYEVEKEPKYKVKVKNTDDYLNETEVGFHFFDNSKKNKTFTRKELEYSDFAWVLDCPGIELEEVE